MFATAVLMHAGHSPDAIADMAWRDVEAYLIAFPYLQRFGGI